MNRPKADEYAAFYTGYINLVPEGPIIDILEGQAVTTSIFFGGINEELANHAYEEGKWTIKQVLGHMTDAERTFAYRILAFSRGQEELPGFDENAYVENSTFTSRPLADLAAEYKAVREANLYLLCSLTEEQSAATGIANNYKISVRAIVYVMAGHELHHLNILKERYLAES